MTGSTVSFTHARPCVVTATQAGNNDWNDATTDQTIDIAKGDQTVTFAPVTGAKVGTDAPLTATSSAGLDITFSTNAAACTVTGSTVSFTHARPCVVTATQAGNNDWNDATTDQTIDIAKGDQTVSFTSQPPAKPAFGTTYTPTATSGSGAAVTFSIDATTSGFGQDNQSCRLTDGVVTFRHAGACVIAAGQPGTDDYNAAPTVTQSVSTPKAAQRIDVTFTSDRPVIHGTGTLAVTAQGDSGNPVTFATTTPAVCTVIGSTVLFDHAGACAIAADQAGNDDYNAAPTVVQKLTVAKGDQKITFTSTPPAEPKLHGQYTVTATGGDSGKPVTFSSTTPTVCTVTGSTVTFDHAGPCAIAADQAGSDDYNAAPTVVQKLTVAKGDQKITFTSTPPAEPKLHGQYTVTATGGDSGKPVTFSSTTPTVCTVTGSTVTFDHAGPCAIAADQAGSDDYNAAPTVVQKLTVAKGDQKITFTAPTGATVGGSDVLHASAPGGPVTYAIDPATTGFGKDAQACTMGGTQDTLTYRHVGTCAVTARQTGNDDFTAAAPITQSFSIAQADQKITFSSSPPSPARAGTTYTVTATSTSGLPVTFSAAAGTSTNVCTVTAAGLVSFKSPGDCAINADQAGNADYTKAPTVTQRATVSEARRDLTMVITTQPGWLFGIFGTVVNVQVVGLDPGAHATLQMTAHHAIAFSPGSCDANGDDNHSQCAVTTTPTTFSFLALAFQSNPTLEFEVTSKDTQDSNPNDNSQTVQLGN